MSTTTDFNQPPYNDDFDESKGYYRTLFKPSVAVQAREQTQLQTVLQNQIQRFGDNIIREGSIVKGCNFTYLNKLPYAKILDLQTDGQPVVMSNYNDAKLVGLTSGVEAIVVSVLTGLESQSPDLNTLFFRYIKSNGANKTFSTTENIRIENATTAAVIATVTVAGTVESNSIGTGTGVRVGDGIIYQKGFFVSVNEQFSVVQRYSSPADGTVVGFSTEEQIINSFNDTSLLDNAQGEPNENAPGADRLKLTPVLTVTTKALADADEKFFTILEYQNGIPVKRKESTEYAVIGSEISRRTSDESGDYVVRDFPSRIVDNAANTSLVDVSIGPGLAYVEGFRIEKFGTTNIPLPVASDFNTETGQNVTTNIGNYVIVDEFIGNIKFNELNEVSIYDTAQNALTGGTVVTSPSGTLIGTAKVRSFEYNTGTAGTAACQYRMYLFDIRMSDATKTFADDAKSFFFNGTNKGNADAVLENSKTVIKDQRFKKSIWDIGREFIKDIPTATTDYVYRTVNELLTVSTGGVCSITLSGNDEWPYGASATLNSIQKQDLVLISNETQAPYTTGIAIDLSGTTITTDVTGQTLTISSLSAPAAEMDVIAYYNVKKTQAAPAEKQTTTVYIKVSAATSGTTGTYNLGLPDIYEIVSVRLGAGPSDPFTLGTEGNDVTSQFRLIPNQKDTYYDLSYVQKNRSLTITGTDWLLFQVKVFKEFNAGSFGDGFFTINSYTGIDLEDIPVYKSENFLDYYLRDSVDFRPYAANTVDYATTVGTASTISGTVGDAPTFPAAEQFIPAPNQNMEIDYEYYLGRKDLLILDKSGNFSVVRGISAEKPVFPARPTEGLVLGEITVPPFPSLPPYEADLAKKSDYGVKLKRESIRGYTMDAIGKIDRRVRQLEYYTVLSALETSANDKNIVDENGNTRFKNGIFTDSFEDLSIGDTRSSEFSASIDPSFKELAPSFKQFNIDFKVANTTGASVYEPGITLVNSDAVLIEQPYSTRARNAVTDFYKFIGTTTVNPEYDAGFNEVTAPPTNFEIDIASPFMEFTENLQQFVPMQSVSSRVASSTVSQQVVNRGWATDTITTTRQQIQTTVSQFQAGSGETTENKVGDFVTDVRFSPFMRGRELQIISVGLRPLTEMHVFFDQASVDQYVAPALSTSANENDVRSLRRTRAFGTTLTTDANGVLRFIFSIPEDTFFVGDREIEIMDLTSYDEKSNAVSYSKSVYNAYNFSVEKSSLNISTREPEFGVQSTSTSRTAVSRNVIQTRQDTQDWNNGDWWGEGGGFDLAGGDDSEPSDDPIAQTFTVSESAGAGDTQIFVTKVDLFLESKSDTNGATVMIRETENGVPAARILPFAKKHVNASEFTANTTTPTATTVTFDAPVALATGREYCIVVKPDGNDPDYRLWLAKTGEVDKNTNIAITQDVNSGTLFTSTNDKSWTPYQDENLTYKLYRAEFTANTGTVTFVNKESEYLTVNAISGAFKSDEYVFVDDTAVAAQTVNIEAGNTTVVGTSTTFTTYISVGEHLVVAANSTVYDVLEVENVVSDTELTMKDFPKYTNTSADFFKSIVGTVSLFDSNEPARLFLDNSTADATTYFLASDVLKGHDSGASATLESVDNKNISFVAPNIYRSNSPSTRTLLSAPRLFRSDTNINYTASSLEFNNNNYLTLNPTVVKSRSNELADSDTDRSFALTVTMSNIRSQFGYSSPFIDADIASARVYEYLVNNDSTDEDGSDGASESKYISKRVTLQDGLDAEDLKVYLTAYRPPGTTIEVYAKFLNEGDPDDFNSKPWSQMVAKSSNPFSQNSNRFDFKEFEFDLDTSAPATGAAFLNASNVFEYQDGTAVYNDYKYFAIKVVLLSEDFSKVPRLADIRAIALAA